MAVDNEQMSYNTKDFCGELNIILDRHNAFEMNIMTGCEDPIGKCPNITCPIISEQSMGRKREPHFTIYGMSSDEE